MTNQKEKIRVPILKKAGIEFPLLNETNFEGWVFCDAGIGGKSSLICVVANEQFSDIVGIRVGDHLIIALELGSEPGEYVMFLLGGVPIIGLIEYFLSKPNQFIDAHYVGCVVALVRKF